MADTLCGPSNALQNFQKHTTLDRTLQQDRLIGRHSPVQGFRSSPGATSGALDHEFEAFQGARPGTLKDLQPFSRQFAPPPPPTQQFAPAPLLPDWATEFQRLTLSAPAPQAVQHSRPQTANTASAWHQDFMRQQSSTPAPQAPALQQNTYGSMPGYGMSAFAGPSFMQTPAFQTAPVADSIQGNQRAQEAIPAFDEAAFEDAFAQAQKDMLDVAEAEQAHAEPLQAQPEATAEMDPLLEQLRETRPAVFSAIQVWSETGLGRTEEAVSYLENMHQLEQSGNLVQDANEAKWIVDSLQSIVVRDAPQEVKTRAESLISAINQRLMSQYPLTARAPMSEEQIWRDIQEAGYMRTPERERIEQQPEQQQEQPALNDDDEMAVTAGRLLERVADNQSEKFQNSQFFQLMRKLRDHEVRVQEDKIVEVSEQDTGLATQNAPTSTLSFPYTELQQQHSQPAARAATQIPGIDPEILNHAAMDMEMPIYSDQGHEQSQTTSEPDTSMEEEEEPSTMADYEPYLDDLAEWDRARTEAAAKETVPAEPETKIPRHEQDEDLYRDYDDVWAAHRVPGRDPVTKARGPPESVPKQFDGDL